jgi:hypothetical protein
MESGSAIINAAMGKWYPRGQQRLIRSLVHWGYAGDLLTWANDPIDTTIYDPACPYTIKAAAVQAAMDAGHSSILWLDCSIWAIADPNPFVKLLEASEGLFLRSGFNLAQTAKDASLGYAGLTRDDAEALPELWSCIFGFNLRTERGRRVAERFVQSARDGVFHGSREHDGQSQDARFLFHRQDQTALSLAFHAEGMDQMLHPETVLWQAHEGSASPGIIWAMRGIA